MSDWAWARRSRSCVSPANSPGRRAALSSSSRAQLGAGQFKAPGDAQLVGAGAQQLGRAALAEQQAERFEQQRLAGAGLAGPSAEAGAQLDADVFDEGQVLDEEFSQHRLRSSY